MSRAGILASAIYVVLTGLACAGLAAGAALAPAPAAVIPIVAIAVVVTPMLAAWHLATVMPSRRTAGEPTAALAIAQLRRSLDELPEAEHPLGL